MELVARILDPLASGLDVIHAHADVTEALVGIFVAIVNGEVGVALRTVIVGEFEDAFAVGPVVAGRGRMRPVVRWKSDGSAYSALERRRVVTKKVQVELVVWEFYLVD